MAAGRWGAAALLAAVLTASASAQVPPDLAAANRAMAGKIDPLASARAYGPLAERAPFKGVKVVRDVSYGPDRANVLDVFTPEQAEGRARPVVMYVSGGAATRIEHIENGEPFYDNVMVWAVRNGMVGVNVERRHWRGTAWDAGARDIGAAIQWVRRNIASRGGDPNRIIFIGHAYGGTTLATYLAHPELQGPDGVGLSAAVLIGAPFNLAPANAIAPAAGNPMFDPAHSNLEGMKALRIPVFLGVGELETADALSSATVLRDQLCGAGRCPSYRAFPDHGHISVMFSFNTADRSVSGPVLDWMRNLR